MAHYENSYSEKEDPMLWHLHEIRHKIAGQNQSPEQINAAAGDIIRQYGLNNLKIVSMTEKQRLVTVTDNQQIGTIADTARRQVPA